MTGAGLGAGRATGARIGFGIAKALPARGAKIAVNDIDPERVDTAVREIQQAGGTASARPSTSSILTRWAVA